MRRASCYAASVHRDRISSLGLITERRCYHDRTSGTSLPISSVETRPSERAPHVTSDGHPRTRPNTSLIICSRNRPQLLCQTVQSVLAGSEVPTEFVIVDQSESTNGELEQLAAAEAGTDIRYLRSATRGLSSALNAGIRAARYERLLFTHDDVSVDPHWHQIIVDALLGAREPIVVTGQVLPESVGREGGWFVPSTKIDPTPRTFSGRIWSDPLYPLNMAMDRRTFEIVGPFDERLGPGTPFPAAEDNDYGYRVLEAGCRIEYVPAAVVVHRAWRNDVVSLRWAYALGQGGFYAKHLRARDWYIARRAGRELRRYVTLATQHALHRDVRARWYAASSVGLLVGLARWTLAHRMRLSP
jgi:GT2 family glycosyltransferase